MLFPKIPLVREIGQVEILRVLLQYIETTLSLTQNVDSFSLKNIALKQVKNQTWMANIIKTSVSFFSVLDYNLLEI